MLGYNEKVSSYEYVVPYPCVSIPYGADSVRVGIQRNRAQSAGERCRLVHHTVGVVKVRCEAKGLRFLG